MDSLEDLLRSGQVDCQRDWSCVDHDDPRFGDAGIATNEERIQLDELREKCAEQLRRYPHDFPEVVGDVRLLRFLRGHAKIESAAEYLNNHLRFRENNGIDAMREKIVAEGLDFSGFPGFDAIMKYMPFNHEFAYARHGHLVSTQWNGRWDAVGLALAVQAGEEITREGFIEFWRWVCELSSIRSDLDSRKAGVLLGQIVICDFRCVRLGQLSPGFISVVKDWVTEFQDNYPEMNTCTVYFNTPSFFSVVWAFFSYLLSEGLKSKVQIFSEGSLKAHKVLLEKISAHNLPTEFGGLARPMSKYCESTDFVPPVRRKSSSLTGHTGLGFTNAKAIYRHYHPRISIPAGQFHYLPIEMYNAGDMVSWEWTVEAHDVLFTVHFEPSDCGLADKNFTVVKKKVRSEHAEVGQYVADGKGLLTLHFDNTHSRLRGKTITYGRIAFDAVGTNSDYSESDERFKAAHLRITGDNDENKLDEDSA